MIRTAPTACPVLRTHLLPAALAAALLALGGGAPTAWAEHGEPPVVFGSRVHKMPRHDGTAPVNTAAPAGAHLTYFGGPVISNVSVVQVLWGTGSYMPQVSSTASPSMATFYGGVGNSAYFDWLTEYNTNITASGGGAGTNQSIGRGSFRSQVTITPTVTAATITDAQIQAQIVSDLNAGILPAPTTDATGHVNTIYMINFPHGKTITQGGSNSCQAGGFCAYHGTLTRGTQNLFYGVLPDMQAGSGCDLGCGASTPFNNQTSVASHELIEAVTDPDVGLATVIGPPLAWYDQTNGEIGDICNAQQGTVVGGDGVTYTVQTEFSNVANNCIVTRPVAGNDFSLSVSPASQSVNAGSSISYTVATATTSGSAQTVTFSVSGLPAGVTGAFSPTSVSSGQSSTLTLSAASGAASTTAAFTVQGTATSGSHSAGATVTVVGAGGGGGGTLVNGGFETGDLTGWTSTGTAVAVAGGHSGSFAARVGSLNPSVDSSIAQTFTTPAGATTLSFFYKVVCPDTITFDWATATLRDNTAGTTATVLARTCTNNNTWVQASSSVVAAHSYTLTLSNHDDNFAGDPTFTLYDDVAIGTGTPPPGGIVNGGFEGSLTGWTSTGVTSDVAGGHSGANSARVGTTTPTGTSSLAQTFTVPSGLSQLSIWYANSCPDTVTFDWVTITLRDNTTGTTRTVLPRTCARTFVFTNVTTAVTAGHSYTLTLTNRDDNFAGDPTFTQFDDVTLN